MKAYKDSKGRIRLFRPECNMNRMRVSSIRLALPDFNPEELIKCIKELLKIDKEWIPAQKGYSLYIRPTHISMMNKLGVKAPNKSKLFVVTSPTGAYFPEGFKPIDIYCEDEYIRAAPKGVGCYKVGGNYAPTLMV